VPDALDRNPILNAMWLFPAGTAPDLQDVLAGRADSQALCVVDVGGPGDGPIAAAGKVEFPGGQPTYRADLEPGARQELAFLVATGNGSVPTWAETPWALPSLRRAADDVWAGCFARGTRDLDALGDAAWECRSAVADILMSRTQCDDYYLAVGDPLAEAGTASCMATAARLVQALDRAGFGREAERLLRVYWDRPPPASLARYAQHDDGHWEDGTAALCPHAQILLALARHAATSRNPAWLARAYPTIRAGADWIRVQRAAGGLPGTDLPWLALALTATADAASLAGQPDDAAWMREEATALGVPAADGAAAYANLGPCVDAANRVLAITAPADGPASGDVR